MLRRRANAFMITLLILVGGVILLDCLLLGGYFVIALIFGFDSPEVSHLGKLFAFFGLAIAALAVGVAAWQFCVCWRNPLKGTVFCPACGYNMHGRPKARKCPECGANIEAEPPEPTPPYDPLSDTENRPHAW